MIKYDKNITYSRVGYSCLKDVPGKAETIVFRKQASDKHAGDGFVL